MKTTLTFYKSFFLWRWRLTANNGKIIGASTQGYWNTVDCEDNAKSVGVILYECFS